MGSMFSCWKPLGQPCFGIQNFLDFIRGTEYLNYAKPLEGSGRVFRAFWIRGLWDLKSPEQVGGGGASTRLHSPRLPAPRGAGADPLGRPRMCWLLGRRRGGAQRPKERTDGGKLPPQRCHWKHRQWQNLLIEEEVQRNLVMVSIVKCQLLANLEP